MIQPVPLAKLIGSRLRQIREEHRCSQEEIAAGARATGFLDWTRGTVAMIESGRRRLSLEEFLALPIILTRAGLGEVAPPGPGFPLADLIGSEGLAALSPFVAVSAERLRTALSSHSDPFLDGARNTPERVNTPEIQEARRVWRRSGPGDQPDPGMLYHLVLESRGGAEVHAARVLGISPVAVATAAHRLWGRPLTVERDARVRARVEAHVGTDVADVLDQAARRGLAHPAMLRVLQAQRGHVTRELLAQLRAVAVKTITKSRRGKGGK